jgi:hypothetical protein
MVLHRLIEITTQIGQVESTENQMPGNATHDSGTGWLATPFLYGSFIHDSKPVYPGALNKLPISWSCAAKLDCLS